MTTSQNDSSRNHSIDELRSLLSEVQSKIAANKRRQNDLGRRMDYLRDEASELKKQGFHQNRERIEAIQGVYAKKRVPLMNEDGTPKVDDQGEAITVASRFRDEYGQWVMRREGEITMIIREKSGFDGEPGLYHEFGMLKKLELELRKKIRSMDGGTVANRIKGLDGLMGRFHEMGLELPEEEYVPPQYHDEEAIEDEPDVMEDDAETVDNDEVVEEDAE